MCKKTTGRALQGSMNPRVQARNPLRLEATARGSLNKSKTLLSRNLFSHNVPIKNPWGFPPYLRTPSLRSGSVASKTAVFGPPGSDGSGVAVAFAEATVALAGSCGAATGMLERHRAWDEAVEAAPFPIFHISERMYYTISI